MVIGLFSFSGHGAEHTLRLASWGPVKHYVGQAREQWLHAVREQAGDELEIIEYPGGQLYGPKEMHMAVAKGLVDMGVVLQPRLMATVPLLQGVYLPFAFDSLSDAAKAYEGESLAIIDNAMQQKRLKLVFPSFLGGVQIYSTQGPINTTEDFSQLRILATSPIMTRILSLLGASPDTSIPQTEQYMALKRGVGDAITSTIVGGYFQKSFEVAPHLTLIEMSYPTSLIVMNLESWNKLPVHLQQLLLREGEKQKQYTLAATAAWEAKFSAQLQKEGGLISQMPAASRQQIKQLSRQVWLEWAKATGPEATRLLELNISASGGASKEAQ